MIPKAWTLKYPKDMYAKIQAIETTGKYTTDIEIMRRAIDALY